jgi:hypothetical protein
VGTAQATAAFRGDRRAEQLASDDLAEPEPFDVESEVPHHRDAGPAGGQHRAVQHPVRRTLQDAEHVTALVAER